MNPRGMFANTATVTPYTISEDASNGSAKRAAGATFTIACSLQPRSSSEGLDMGRDFSRKQAVMYYGATDTGGTAFTLGMEDTVTLGGEIFKVIGKPRDVGGRGVYFEADLEAES